jgi:hypothetical protein
MKILGYHETKDPDLARLEHRAIDYLLKTGADTRGKWTRDDQGFYDKYHSAYCAVIGILPYYFSEVCHGIISMELNLNSVLIYL